MDWGILSADVKQRVYFDYTTYETKKEALTYSPQTTTTTTFSPTSVQDITYAPQYIIGSPEASAVTKKEGASAQPIFDISPSQTVAPVQSDVFGKAYQEAPMEGGGGGLLSGVTGIFAIGVLAVGVVAVALIVKKAPKSKTGLIKKVAGA